MKLAFSDDAIEALARFAVLVNEQTENIGARRLHTILERVLDEISFEAPELKKEKREGGCRLRRQATHGDRQESGSEPLHSLIFSV